MSRAHEVGLHPGFSQVSQVQRGEARVNPHNSNLHWRLQYTHSIAGLTISAGRTTSREIREIGLGTRRGGEAKRGRRLHIANTSPNLGTKRRREDWPGPGESASRKLCLFVKSCRAKLSQIYTANCAGSGVELHNSALALAARARARIATAALRNRQQCRATTRLQGVRKVYGRTVSPDERAAAGQFFFSSSFEY